MAAAAAVAAGCGGSGVDRSACRGEVINEAAAAVVQQAYSRGMLGSRALVERELGHAHGSFFGSDDHMIPYPKLSNWQKSEFNEWMRNSPRVEGITNARVQAAESRATATLDDRC